MRWSEIIESNSLEQYRLDALKEIEDHKEEWSKRISSVLGLRVVSLEPNGSVLDPKRFHKDSDIDILVRVSTNKYPEGALPDLSELLSGMIFGNVSGMVDVGVYNIGEANALERDHRRGL